MTISITASHSFDRQLPRSPDNDAIRVNPLWFIAVEDRCVFGNGHVHMFFVPSPGCHDLAELGFEASATFLKRRNLEEPCAQCLTDERA